MPRFSEDSKQALKTCHPDLQEVLNKAIKYKSFSVLEGHRSKERQNELFEEGRTQVQWPNSKHNNEPSRAVDVVPYPVDWSNHKRFAHLAGFIEGIAEVKGIALRWGGDWDCDGDITDNSFDDLGHFELVEVVNER